jgi:Antibiotic biosynthesis monooxygenase
VSARKLSIRVKPQMLAEFTSIFEQRIVPFMHRQPGFMDELLLAAPGSRDVLALSFWETSANAEAFHGAPYKDLVAVLAPLIEGAPRVGTPDVLHTTLYESRSTGATA